MPFVLDASVTLAWGFEDEQTAAADAILALLEHDEALAPAIWPLEITNAFLMGERHGRIQPAEVLRFFELLRSLPVTVESPSVERARGTILDLARQHEINCFEASYLELAIREGIRLATLDRQLARAARRSGVLLVE